MQKIRLTPLSSAFIADLMIKGLLSDLGTQPGMNWGLISQILNWMNGLGRYRKANTEKQRLVLQLYLLTRNTICPFPSCYVSLSVLIKEMLRLSVGSPRDKTTWVANSKWLILYMGSYPFTPCKISIQKTIHYSLPSPIWSLFDILNRLILIKTHTPSKGPDYLLIFQWGSEEGTFNADRKAGPVVMRGGCVFGWMQFSICWWGEVRLDLWYWLYSESVFSLFLTLAPQWVHGL